MKHSAQTSETISAIHISNVQLFLIFFKLGCIAFGGPAAHLLFFHQKFVRQLQWFDEFQYSQLVALAQILPGPSSSQVGIAIGYLSKGYAGSISAWLGFSLPSFIIMTTAAYLGQHFLTDLSSEIFHVIKLIVLAVVMSAFWQMLKSFCHAVWQYLLMLASALFIYLSDLHFSQIILIGVAAGCGLLFSHRKKKTKKKATVHPLALPNQSFPAYIWLILFGLPFILLPIIQAFSSNPVLYSLEKFYHTAAMVFGGGHIVLPLLHQEFVDTGLISSEKFDLGYAIAQLIPGPLFSFASYLGALLPLTDSMLLNAVLATVSIFLPSFLLIYGTLPYWSWLMNQPKIYQAVEGINAAVIGLLLCLIAQMTESSIKSWIDIAFVLALVLLLRTRIPVYISLLGAFVAYYSLMLYLRSLV